MVHKGKKAYVKQRIKWASSEAPKGPKKARVIVRNLPFKNLSEKSVEEFFREYGDVEEVKLLKKDDGCYLGCGFIQFRKVTSAAKAIRHANEKEMSGRKIVVDWALPKNKFVEKIKKLEEDIKKNDVKQEKITEEEGDVDFVIDNRAEAFGSDDSDSEGSANGSEENESDDDSDEVEGDGYKKRFSKGRSDKGEEQQFKRSKDVEEGRTVFIRNIPFSATNEDLKSCFEKYGAVEYALICLDKLTEHSKGTGFVKFKEKESAAECIKDSNKIFLHENPLTTAMALSKESLESMKTFKKVVKDSRNLYLIREGVIVAGSKAAEGVSAGDMAKRLQLEQWKNQILKNLNMFVSKTRLVIHNLPSFYDDSKLRALFVKYSSPNSVIKEAKVMYDKKSLIAAGKNISKEVGFVSFTNHDDALFALRNINNNPNIFGMKKRPIVAFSIENKAAINSKVKRMEKSRAKLGVGGDNSGIASKLNRKQRRFLKRRNKFIAMRKEKKGESKPAQVGKNENQRKRERKSPMEEEPKEKKRKMADSNQCREEEPKNTFAGVISESGKKIKLRTKFRLKNQANIHNETLKKERQKKREKEKKKVGRTKLPREKKRRPKLIDDSNLSKLLKKHRESVQESSVLRKWYEK